MISSTWISCQACAVGFTNSARLVYMLCLLDAGKMQQPISHSLFPPYPHTHTHTSQFQLLSP
jgi:hypothetical protein